MKSGSFQTSTTMELNSASRSYPEFNLNGYAILRGEESSCRITRPLLDRKGKLTHE
jgi:hypothetical protein